MRKKLMFLAVAAIMSLSAWADTPEKAFERHPDAIQVSFFHTKKEVAKGMPKYGVESVFIVRPLKVFIKTEVSDRELERRIAKRIEMPDGMYAYGLEGGEVIAWSGDTFLWLFPDGSSLKCTEDNDKWTKFDELRRK